MTDRVLLELALKAHCDKPIVWLDGNEPYSSGKGFVLYDNGLWNPLVDDGQAFRLANKLRLRIEHHVNQPYVAVFTGTGFNLDKFEEPIGSDINAATRLAIVRAAASIGESMP